MFIYSLYEVLHLLLVEKWEHLRNKHETWTSKHIQKITKYDSKNFKSIISIIMILTGDIFLKFYYVKRFMKAVVHYFSEISWMCVLSTAHFLSLVSFILSCTWPVITWWDCVNYWIIVVVIVVFFSALQSWSFVQREETFCAQKKQWIPESSQKSMELDF